MPAVIWIHGGGWRTGDKYPSPVDMLARRGFFGVSINYRLSGVATFPAAAEDSKCAVRWLRANAKKYNVDPGRIGVWGGSAGGHLAMLVATADETSGLDGSGGWEGTSSRVQAGCSYFGPSDFTVFPVPYFLGGTYRTIPATYRLASPVTHVSKDDPPLLMVHGDMDQTVPLSQSELMLKAYQELGLEATLVKVIGAGHGFTQVTDKLVSPSLKEIDRLVLDFFVKHLLSAR